MSSKGWIKLHRKILDNPVFQDPYLFKLWMYCLLKASHTEHQQLVGNEVVTLNEGQFIWGRNEATNELNLGTKPKERKSPSTWERYLKILENLQMLNRKTNNKFTVVTIEKWAFYQGSNEESEQHSEQQVNSKRTASEQQVNTNKNLRIKELKNNTTTSTAREENNSESDAIIFYQQNFGMIRPAITQELLVFINDFGDELVIEALQRAINRNKPNWGYAKSILQDWGRKGIKTIEQAKAEEVEFQNQQQQRRPSYKPSSRKGVVPEWYEDQKKQHEKMLQQDSKPKEEIEQKQKELESFFSQFQQ